MAERPPCTFCGAASITSDPCVGNREQLVHTCRARQCRDEFARLTVDTGTAGGFAGERQRIALTIRKKKRQRRRPRQRTHQV